MQITAVAADGDRAGPGRRRRHASRPTRSAAGPAGSRSPASAARSCVEGRVAADGRAPGTTGGEVIVMTRPVTVARAPARGSAPTGHGGGGTVALGTTLARARATGPAPRRARPRAVVAAGARDVGRCDAQRRWRPGDGAEHAKTGMAGAVSARGGKQGGNGGTIELSGEAGFRLTGIADTSAPHGAVGSIVLDPRDLTITARRTARPTPRSGPAIRTSPTTRPAP